VNGARPKPRIAIARQNARSGSMSTGDTTMATGGAIDCTSGESATWVQPSSVMSDTRSLPSNTTARASRSCSSSLMSTARRSQMSTVSTPTAVITSTSPTRFARATQRPRSHLFKTSPYPDLRGRDTS
jgi:hypothetical protein